ncbi:MAG: DUF106 domain-containing protein [Thermoplasmata archaeon]
MAGKDRPLPSGTPSLETRAPAAEETEEEAKEEAAEVELEEEIDQEDAKPRPPPAEFKLSTFVYTFLFVLGILMLFDTSTRYGVAQAFGLVLGPVIGFGGHWPLVTMFFAAAFEMVLTALAYNYTTDWIKAARVQKWSAAFRKVQMAAMRSGKKDRIEALREHQATLTKLSSEMSFAQIKGMAITWFLVIAIYSWVFLFLADPSGYHTIVTACHAASNCSVITVNIGTSSFNLLGDLIGPLQAWFIVFSLYTVPLSLIFRRLLKHYKLSRIGLTLGAPVQLPTGPGGTA